VDVAGATCAAVLPGSSGTLTCSSECKFDVTACIAPPMCGNGTLDPGEACDGVNLAGVTCESLLGAGSTGTPTCTLGCTLDSSGCAPAPTCNNGIIDPGESCDGANLGGATCASALNQPTAIGQLTCHANCTFNTSACTSCGDGYLQGGEQCDDGNATNGDGCDGCIVKCVGEEKQLGLNCYGDVISSTSWAAAQASCSSFLGGHLVTITSSSENDFVGSEVLTFFSFTERWIGFTDAASEGTFAWVTGEWVPYTNWRSGQPDEGPGGEDCAEFRFFDSKWNDNGCSVSRPYVCEYEPPVLHP
jgi:cysteine-rich repeat protein